MTDVALPIRPFAFHVEDRRLLLEFDLSEENRRFCHLVFEAALEGEPMVLRPTAPSAADLDAVRAEAAQRIEAAESRERDARERMADAERALAAERSRRESLEQAAGPLHGSADRMRLQ